MIIDLVRYLGICDSAEARDSVFLFRRTPWDGRGWVGCTGCEDCRVSPALGDGRGFELAFGGGEAIAAFRAAADELGRFPAEQIC